MLLARTSAPSQISSRNVVVSFVVSTKDRRKMTAARRVAEFICSASRGHGSLPATKHKRRRPDRNVSKAFTSPAFPEKLVRRSSWIARSTCSITRSGFHPKYPDIPVRIAFAISRASVIFGSRAILIPSGFDRALKSSPGHMVQRSNSSTVVCRCDRQSLQLTCGSFPSKSSFVPRNRSSGGCILVVTTFLD